jgi:PAS domain S-box-containing protein
MTKTLFESFIKALGDGIAEKGWRGLIARTVFITLMTGPLLLFMVFGYISTFKQFTESIYSEKKAIAYLSSTIIKERLDILSQIGTSLANRPRVIENAMIGKWDDAINTVSNVFSAFPFIDGLDILDAQGILKQGISPYQKMGREYSFDDHIGKDYSFRDFYKEVKANRTPYVSDIYKRINAPHNNILAVAAPIMDIRNENVIGVLVMQIQLHTFAQWAREITIGPEGFIYFVDHHGHLLYHPDYNTEKDNIDYTQAPAVRRLIQGRSGLEINYNPLKKQKYLVAYEPVPKYGWGVVVAQPVKAAFVARNRNSAFALILYSMIIVIAFLSAVVIVNILVERRRMELSLQASESRYRGLFSSIRDGIILTDINGMLIDFNQAFVDMLGYAPEELVKMSYREFTPEKWHELQKSITESQVLPRGYSSEFEIEHIKKTGVIFPVLVRIWVVKDDQGIHSGIWAIVRDITQRKRAEEEIRALNASLHEHALELEVVNKELQAFSYSVSHDLRAPLRAIEGFSKIVLAEQNDKLDPRGKDYLSRISSAAKSMAILIDDLLTLAKVVRAPLRKEQFDLSALAAEVVYGLAAEHPESRVECVIAPGLRATGDIQLCKIVLENLLGNAWKFTAHVSHPVVEFGNMQKDGKNVFFIRDNGAGFDMAYVNKLFVPFQRLHSTVEFPGSGIGLASVLRIISRHGGTIWAEGYVNKGAAFYFTL